MAYDKLGYVSLLYCVGIISRFGRQVRLGEHVDSGLTAYQHSEFATLDKTRQKHKTRLGRFITSPRLACRPQLARHHHNFHTSFWGQTPCRVGPGPEKCAKNVLLFRYYLQLLHKW